MSNTNLAAFALRLIARGEDVRLDVHEWEIVKAQWLRDASISDAQFVSLGAHSGRSQEAMRLVAACV